jgi:hypothetical protein
MTYFGSTDFLLEVAKGKIPGHSLIEKFGGNHQIDTNTVPESIWNGGGLYTGFSCVAAQTVDVTSTSTDDDVAGIGALTVRLEGLDGSYVPVSEDVTLTGLTIATTNATFLRLDRAFVLTAGSTGWNVGDIEMSQTTSGFKMVDLPAERGQTHIAPYTVPAGISAIAVGGMCTLNDAQDTSAQIDIYVRELGGVFHSKYPFGISRPGGPVHIQNLAHLLIPEKSDIDVRCVATSSANTQITMVLNYLLIDNNYL